MGPRPSGSGAAKWKVFQFLQYQHPTAFGKNKTFAPRVEGARSFSGVIIEGERQRSHGAESGNTPSHYLRFDAASDHQVSRAVPDILCSPADGLRPGCTGGRDGRIWPQHLEMLGDHKRRDIRYPGGHHERADFRMPKFFEDCSAFFQLIYSSDRRTEEHPGSFRVWRPRVEAGVFHRVHRCRQRDLAAARHPPRILAVHIIFSYKIWDLAGNLARHIAGVELGDAAYPRTTARQPFPKFAQVRSQC